MSSLRVAIVLITCLLLALCLLFPIGIPADSWFPGFGWLPDVIQSMNATGEHFEIVWGWVAEEMMFFLLAAGIVWIGTYMERCRAIRLFLDSLFLAVIAPLIAFGILRWGALEIALLTVDGALFLALMMGLYPARSSGNALTLKLHSLDTQRPTGRSSQE